MALGLSQDIPGAAGWNSAWNTSVPLPCPCLSENLEFEIISHLAMGRDLIFKDQSSQDGRRNVWTSLARGRREMEPTGACPSHVGILVEQEFWECGLGSSPELWCKALIHLGALAQEFREQRLAWRVSVSCSSLQINNV